MAHKDGDEYPIQDIVRLGTRPWRADEGDVPAVARRDNRRSSGLGILSLGALGIVYGDIGTSPLYAFRECFHPTHGLSASPANLLGVLSLILWALILIVVLKYLCFILRADNHGEGGTLTLLALLRPAKARWLVPLALFGTALLYGDGIITPAISVLSALEGLESAAPGFRPLVVPATVGILFALFAIQKRGTARIGAIFGPVMLLWFVTIAAIAVPWIVRRPEVLTALDPRHALDFFTRNGWKGFAVLSAVVLCVTGAEALYADMGHFGKRPIRAGWFAVVMPSLMLNYFGQGALVLAQGEAALKNPFFGMVSGGWLFPLVALATAATIIASQALISGAYSLTQQAIQLGYLPRTEIRHTSREARGQIYVGEVNRWLMVGSIALVIIFRNSSGLAAAYGIAVTGTMMITTLLFFALLRTRWKWGWPATVGLISIFMTVDLAFLGANISKIPHGGWIPIGIAVLLLIIMTTWKRGRDAMAVVLGALALPLGDFLAKLDGRKSQRTPGTAIFMTTKGGVAPPTLRHHFRHNHALHERVLLMTIVTADAPFVADDHRVSVSELKHGFYRIQAIYGFMETPDVSEILIHCLSEGLVLDIEELSFYLGRETILPTGDSGMMGWRKRLFTFLYRLSRPAVDYFGIPPDQVIELGFLVRI